MRVAGRRRERWRRSPNIWGRRRDADSPRGCDRVVVSVDRLWLGGSREEFDVRRGMVESEAAARDGYQRRKSDDGRDGQDADGVMAGGEVFGGREERSDSE